MLYKKAAVSLVEMAVAIAILAILCAGVIVSRSLITTANVQAVYNDIVDFTSVTTFFTSEYGCAPGDCPMAVLPSKIINATPSGCFNLSTTTGMGNATSPGNGGTSTVLATPYIAGFSTGGIIDSNAKRTCAFYEMQAFEPAGFGGSATASSHSFGSILGIQSANAIGVGKLDLSMSNINVQNASTPSAANVAAYNAAYPSTPITITNATTTYNTQSNTSACTPIAKAFSISPIRSTDSLACQVKNGAQYFNPAYIDTGVVATLTSARGNNWTPFWTTTSTWDCKLNGQTIPWNAQCAWSAVRYTDPTTSPQNAYCPGGASYNATGYSHNICNFNGYGIGHPDCNVAVTTTNSLPTNCISAVSNTTGWSVSDSQNNINDFSNTIYTNPLAKYNDAQAKYSLLTAAAGPPTIASTIQTATNPIIKPFKTQAMWDIRTVGSGAASGFYPFESGKIPSAQNKLLFIARDVSTNYIGAELTGTNTAAVTANMPAFSSAFALRLDQKFDDGKPYSGNIIAGQNIGDNTATIKGKGCTTMTTAFASMAAGDLTATYNNSSNLAAGCVLAGVING